jgi:hypothetical protein
LTYQPWRQSQEQKHGAQQRFALRYPGDAFDIQQLNGEECCHEALRRSRLRNRATETADTLSGKKDWADDRPSVRYASAMCEIKVSGLPVEMVVRKARAVLQSPGPSVQSFA